MLDVISGITNFLRINLMRDHRQTVQYIAPEDYKMLAQAELLVIDEAAAIPLPVVKNLLGPYLVFMSSTINGYEGTGRSLSLKLLDSLRRESVAAGKSNIVGSYCMTHRNKFYRPGLNLSFR